MALVNNGIKALALVILCASNALASEQKDLNTLLDQFLAGASNDIEVHKRFWADDLIYTSSSGQRFGKQKIIQGMREAENETEKATASVDYRAEDTDIRLFGDTAVIAFRLVAEPGSVDAGGKRAEKTEFFNTGTFVKRDGKWQAVAWQATKIPPATPPSGD
ncbi:nuclear transport factor 2 family protein [Microbulbifer agarilyticus]|uniref:nuclear transport factor 2 family protein n=1 Tax=Microbulbifer agarilyticus TaxID=260552 RepID=UPI001CD6C77F|nr:nuclear transport factor 2 family protein [Microbulbifer agarilyticus]MCA0901739.1 nuclear transport factor 2 family protein [Microbulbifer agarilyticus]